MNWAVSDGTSITGSLQLLDGREVAVEDRLEAVEDDYYFIVTDKCTECKGFHEEPQCAAVCPVDCCVPDPDHEESEESLLQRQQVLHPEG